jgi:hypothetical protein
VAAILPPTVSICPKFLATVWAGEVVVCFPLYHVHMCVPPLITAGITAEQFLLPFRLLPDFFTTVFAKCILVIFVMNFRQLFSFSSKTMSAAIGLDCFQL